MLHQKSLLYPYSRDFLYTQMQGYMKAAEICETLISAAFLYGY